jgi:hypothetical protein
MARVLTALLELVKRGCDDIDGKLEMLEKRRVPEKSGKLYLPIPAAEPISALKLNHLRFLRAKSKLVKELLQLGLDYKIDDVTPPGQLL